MFSPGSTTRKDKIATLKSSYSAILILSDNYKSCLMFINWPQTCCLLANAAHAQSKLSVPGSSKCRTICCFLKPILSKSWFLWFSQAGWLSKALSLSFFYPILSSYSSPLASNSSSVFLFLFIISGEMYYSFSLPPCPTRKFILMRS